VARFDDHIAHYEGVQGGAAVVIGTRTPVRSIVAAHELAGGDLADILRGLPHLNETQVRAALAYYRQHREEIDADIARHERALAELRKASAGIAG